MRPSLLCLAILLALPGAAQAEQTGAAEPALDLSFVPAVADQQEHADPVPGVIAAPAGAPEEAFSVGLKIKNRPDVGSPAARATAQPNGPETLTDKVEGIVERSSIGVTGTYRF